MKEKWTKQWLFLGLGGMADGSFGSQREKQVYLIFSSYCFGILYVLLFILSFSLPITLGHNSALA